LLVFATAVGLHQYKQFSVLDLNTIKDGLKKSFISDGDPLNIAQEVEFDCRGNIAIVHNYRTISSKEIKSSENQINDCKKQLCLRLISAS
jgi:hypothetical protein